LILALTVSRFADDNRKGEQSTVWMWTSQKSITVM